MHKYLLQRAIICWKLHLIVISRTTYLKSELKYHVRFSLILVMFSNNVSKLYCIKINYEGNRKFLYTFLFHDKCYHICIYFSWYKCIFLHFIISFYWNFVFVYFWNKYLLDICSWISFSLLSHLLTRTQFSFLYAFPKYIYTTWQIRAFRDLSFFERSIYLSNSFRTIFQKQRIENKSRYQILEKSKMSITFSFLILFILTIISWKWKFMFD